MEQKEEKRTLYRIAKGYIVRFMLFSAWFSYTHGADLRRLGFPDYFRIELVTAKVIGAITLLLPFSQIRVRDWVYTGFLISMISALIAHICNHDPVPTILFVSVDLTLIFLSMRYVSRKDIAKQKQG